MLSSRTAARLYPSLRLGAIVVVSVCGLIGALPLHVAAAPSAAGAFFEYLYIESNSGASAGGHAGVRLGEDVYHFQHQSPGIIRATVQPAASFDLEYRGLGNRPIHVQRVAVSPATYERLEAAFRQGYVVQRTHVDLLESAKRDARFLQCLVDGTWPAGRDCGVTLDGAGYFFASPTTGGPASMGRASRHGAAIEDLRREIERLHGSRALARRRQEVRSHIERLRPPVGLPERLEEGRIAPIARGFADDYSDLLLEWLALEVIAGDARPVVSAFRKCPGKLTPSERDGLIAREAYQRRISIDLLTSSRPDRGYPLLVSLARQVALRASIDSGELFVLDTYGAVGAGRLVGVADERRAVLDQVRQERRTEVNAARAAAMGAAASDEQSWSHFEVVANVALEIEGALAGRPLRRHQPELSPGRGAVLRPQWPAPRLEATSAQAAVDRALQRQERITRRLEALYRYDLVRRNCVTEIFRTLNGVADLTGDLGQHVPLRATANFIPFVSAAAVDEAYRVTERTVLPSYRQQELRRVLASSDSWTTRLREGTALTSTIVPFDPDDEVFLFFSTDTVVMRPLVGVANVVFGVGGILVGALSAPVDGARLLRASARGVFYSAPEVAFLNIRKGTVPLLPLGWASAPELRLARAPMPAGGQGGSR